MTKRTPTLSNINATLAIRIQSPLKLQHLDRKLILSLAISLLLRQFYSKFLKNQTRYKKKIHNAAHSWIRSLINQTKVGWKSDRNLWIFDLEILSNGKKAEVEFQDKSKEMSTLLHTMLSGHTDNDIGPDNENNCFSLGEHQLETDTSVK